ncbi:putative transport protein [Phytophthora citrophthora]|uniref:Transport protein n=1 Tax=Phytophthora citrophthora TaxID=4793 RepID=A0AAD9GSE9_9STRA|nr:putative transport protein [Phytophthora citrophthora]
MVQTSAALESSPQANVLPVSQVVTSTKPKMKTVSESKPLLPTMSKIDDEPHALLGMTCVALSAVSFSLTTTAVKYLTYSMSSMEAIFWRSIVAIFLNLVCIWISGQSLHVASSDRFMLFCRCLSGFSSIAFSCYAISQMVLADSSAIVFTSPVFTFFLGACLLHEHIDKTSFACAILSFSGLLCVVRPSFIFGMTHATADTDGSWIAIGSALLGAIGQAFVYISVRKLKGIHYMVVVHYFLLFSIVGSLSYLLLVQQMFVMPSTISAWAAVLGSGVFTFVGQLLLTKGFQLEKAGIASVMRYLDVVCVLIWDSLLLGERINHWSIVGAIIICACTSVIALHKARSTRINRVVKAVNEFAQEVFHPYVFLSVFILSLHYSNKRIGNSDKSGDNPNEPAVGSVRLNRVRVHIRVQAARHRVDDQSAGMHNVIAICQHATAEYKQREGNGLEVVGDDPLPTMHFFTFLDHSVVVRPG